MLQIDPGRMLFRSTFTHTKDKAIGNEGSEKRSDERHRFIVARKPRP